MKEHNLSHSHNSFFNQSIMKHMVAIFFKSRQNLKNILCLGLSTFRNSCHMLNNCPILTNNKQHWNDAHKVTRVSLNEPNLGKFTLRYGTRAILNHMWNMVLIKYKINEKRGRWAVYVLMLLIIVYVGRRDAIRNVFISGGVSVCHRRYCATLACAATWWVLLFYSLQLSVPQIEYPLGNQ